VIQSPRSSRVRSNFTRAAALGALVTALVAALGLAGCGRKGGLDPPPMAAAGDAQTGGQPGATPTLGPDGKPVASAPGKRKTVLDWLID
jgi:predicted small lipoprotein YifL